MWGEIKSPVRYPSANKPYAIFVAMVPLPFVPVMWTDLNAKWGLFRSFASLKTGSKVVRENFGNW